MSNFKEVVKESIEKGIILDSCGEVERFYDYGRYIDLCGLDPKDIVENMQNAGTGGGGSSKTNVVINGVVTEDIENGGFYIAFNATSVVLDMITISMIIDGKTQTVTMQPGSTEAKFGPVEKYCEIENVTVSPQSTSVAKYSANVINPNGNGLFNVSVIKVINNEETLISTEEYKYKDTVNITATDITGYDFDKWKIEEQEYTNDTISFEMPDHDVVVRCYYNIETFTIIWKNYDGTELETDENVPYGTLPSYDGAKPTQAATAQYTYIHNGWTPTVETVTGNTEYTAVFTGKINEYVITFNYKNENGEDATSTLTLEYGTKLKGALGEISTPNYETTDSVYTFNGWDPEITEETIVEGTKTYTAEYTSQTRQYEITFVDEDGTELQKTYVDYGKTPTYTEETPTMKSNDKFDYTFNGWDKELSPVTGKETYTAQFTSTIRKYSLNVEVTNGTYTIEEPTPVVGEFSVSDTEKVVFSKGNLQYNTGNNTWKFADEQYNIIGEDNINIGDPNFDGTVDMFGWSNGSENKFGAIPSNLNEKYEGEFVDWGTLFKGNEEWFTLSKEQWEYLLNTRPNASELQEIAQVAGINGIMLLPDNWERPENCEPTTIEVEGANVLQYTDEQWSIIEKNGAVFLPSAGRRTGGYGNLINKQQEEETENLNEGYYRWQDNTNLWGYYWTSTIDEENKNVSYAINIKPIGNGDFTIGPMVLWSERGRYGQSVRLVKLSNNDTNMYYEYGQDVTIKATSINEHYTIEGEEEIEKTITITGVTDITYVFKPNEYDIMFEYKNANGEDTTSTLTLEYGTKLKGALGEISTPNYETTDSVYTFNGWDPEITDETKVIGDNRYTAVYSSETRQYEILFVNEDGTELQRTYVDYGKTPTYTGETPTKTATAQYSYDFNGWTPAITEVTGDTVYTATFKEEINKYTVTWNNHDGTELEKDENVQYGATPSYDGEEPTKKGDAQYTYRFSGWEPEITDETIVTGDITYTATFDQEVNKYTITWRNYDGAPLTYTTVNYGETPVYPKDGPKIEKPQDDECTYTFSGWIPTIKEVTEDADYTATFVGTKRVYTLTLKDENDITLTVQTITCGEDISNVLEAHNGTIPEGYSVEWININNGEKFTSTIMPTNDLTLKRNYIEKSLNSSVYYSMPFVNELENLDENKILEKFSSFEYNDSTLEYDVRPTIPFLDNDDVWTEFYDNGNDASIWKEHGYVFCIAIPSSVLDTHEFVYTEDGQHPVTLSFNKEVTINNTNYDVYVSSAGEPGDPYYGTDNPIVLNDAKIIFSKKTIIMIK